MELFPIESPAPSYISPSTSYPHQIRAMIQVKSHLRMSDSNAWLPAPFDS